MKSWTFTTSAGRLSPCRISTSRSVSFTCQSSSSSNSSRTGSRVERKWTRTSVAIDRQPVVRPHAQAHHRGVERLALGDLDASDHHAQRVEARLEHAPLLAVVRIDERADAHAALHLDSVPDAVDLAVDAVVGVDDPRLTVRVQQHVLREGAHGSWSLNSSVAQATRSPVSLSRSMASRIRQSA